jgi:hypothetical protein
MVEAILNRREFRSPTMPASDFLTGRICEFMVRNIALEPGFDERCNPGKSGTKELEAAAALIDKYAAKYIPIERFLIENKIKKELQILQLPSDDATMRVIETYCTRGGSVTAQALPPRQSEASPQSKQREQASSPAVATLRQMDKIPCPIKDSMAERLLLGISLYHELYKYVAKLEPTQDNQGVSIDWMNAIEKKRQSETVRTLSDETPGGLPNQEAAAKCFVADYFKNKFNAFKKPEPGHSEQMGNFLTLKITGRNLDDCQLSIMSKIDEKTTNEERDEIIDDLMFYLDKDTEAFSYSITPRSLSEYVSSSSDIRDAYQLLLQLNAKALQDNQSASTLIRDFHEKSKNVKAIVEHPIVVGFGSDGAQPDMIRPHDGPDKAPAIRTTRFGWAILPKLREDGNAQPTDEEYSLTAVVSVPGWWHSAELDIETCWLPRKELYRVTREHPPQPSDGCSGPRAIVIHLPGTYQDVANKLGIAVVEEPHIDLSEDNQALDIYAAGSLLLTGERLWRSTEVTLGTQLADSIVVLPNMKGIVATFQCVLPQAGEGINQPPGGDYYITGVPVRVWTSEGKTEIKPVVLHGRLSSSDKAAQQLSTDSATKKTNPSAASASADNQMSSESEKDERQKCFDRSSRVMQFH